MKRLIMLLVFLALSAVNPVWADSASSNKASDNFDKEKVYLPGEEVVTPTGKKMKVWSTAGPVPVSKAAEPFEDRGKTVVRDPNVVIDATELLKREKESKKDLSTDDSFDHRPSGSSEGESK